MLPEKITRLLAAYIDGELSDRHRRTVHRLLKKSPDARQLYRRLRNDAAGLRDLPAVTAPADLSASILEEISKIELPKPVTAATATQGALPAWVSLSMAAAILAAVTLGSFFLFSNFRPSDDRLPITKKEKRESPRLKLSIAQLAKDESHQALLKEFKKEPTVRLDVHTNNPAQTMDRLSAILGANDFRMAIEPATDKGIHEGSNGKQYVLFVENVLPYELSTILQTLGKEEKQLPSKVCDVELFSVTDENRKQVAGLIGVSAAMLQPAEQIKGGKKPRWPGGGLLPKGKNNKAEPNHEPSKFRQRIALILPLDDSDSGASHATTEAVKQFVAARRVRGTHPNTLQVMLVLHEVRA